MNMNYKNISDSRRELLHIVQQMTEQEAKEFLTSLKAATMPRPHPPIDQE